MNDESPATRFDWRDPPDTAAFTAINLLLLIAFSLHSAFWYFIGTWLATVPCKVWNIADYTIFGLLLTAAAWWLVSLATLVSDWPRRLIIPLWVVAGAGTFGLYSVVPKDEPDLLCPGYEWQVRGLEKLPSARGN